MTDITLMEMTITQNDFFRLLPKALNEISFKTVADTVRFTYLNGEIVIHLKNPRERKIASLSLPVLDVEVHFDSINAEQQLAFLEGFKRTYQRGGG